MNTNIIEMVGRVVWAGDLTVNNESMTGLAVEISREILTGKTMPIYQRVAIVPVDSPCWAEFGKAVFARIAELYPDDCDEWCEEIATMGEKYGITKREPYDIERHGEAIQEYCDPGDMIWSWAHLPKGWRDNLPNDQAHL